MSQKSHQGAITAYRIVRAGHPVFDGSGAARWGGRWTGKGRAVIDVAESYALALLEKLVHFDDSECPLDLVVCQIHIPESVSRQIVHPREVPELDAEGSYAACQALGDRWHEEARTALLIVPSSMSPFEWNMLIHPHHKDVSSMRVSDPLPVPLDKRLKGLLDKGRKS